MMSSMEVVGGGEVSCMNRIGVVGVGVVSRCLAQRRRRMWWQPMARAKAASESPVSFQAVTRQTASAWVQRRLRAMVWRWVVSGIVECFVCVGLPAGLLVVGGGEDGSELVGAAVVGCVDGFGDGLAEAGAEGEVVDDVADDGSGLVAVGVVAGLVGGGEGGVEFGAEGGVVGGGQVGAPGLAWGFTPGEVGMSGVGGGGWGWRRG